MISLDTETTGLDLRHGAKPFFVTTCKMVTQPNGKKKGINKFWHWKVDPLTREPQIPEEDLDEIQATISKADSLVLQNSKFDVQVLSTVLPDLGRNWRWKDTHDTLIAGHLLASSHPHNLTDMASTYLGVDIAPYEKRMKECCDAARRICRSKYPSWRIAKEGLPEMPSVKATAWKNDMWLPAALCEEMGVKAISEWVEYDASWWLSALQEYANVDSAVTLALIAIQMERIKERGLWEIYLERLKVLPVAFKIEDHGVTLSSSRLDEKELEYALESSKAGKTCVSIAKARGFDLTLPKSGNNQSLMSFCFSERGLNLPRIKTSKETGNPSLDKEVVSEYLTSLPEGPALDFIKALSAKRKRDTALLYMSAYRRFWKMTQNKGWYRLHPWLNPTGTATLRWSSTNPNEQNISKQEGFNLRYSFGPEPGREWWSFDAKNIELRLPAFTAPEPDLIYIFENPDKPPYFGSYHLAVFDALYPDLYKEHGKKVKDLFESTYYQWVKNGNFAMIYGCQRAKADSTYHMTGAYDKVRHRFPNIARLADYQIAFAEKYGYVETIPDKTVNPKRGYPLLCTRTEYGNILPTVPLNYHIQGSACWWMMRAMVKVQDYLETLGDYHIAMQVHDELVIDMPSGAGRGENMHDFNFPVAQEIARLMASCGDDLGVPTPIGIEFNPENWSVGITLA